MNDVLPAVVIMLAALASTYETPLYTAPMKHHCIQKEAVETETSIELSGQKKREKSCYLLYQQ